MNTSSLRWAAHAAVALSLAFPAAAQTDVGSAASLGKLPSGLATMAPLKTQSQVPPAAQVQGPTASAKDWVWVGRTAVNLGDHTVDHRGNVDVHSFSYKQDQTAPSGEFDNFEILVLAIPASGGQDEGFLPQAVLLTVMQGKLLRGGASVIETWHFEASGTGQLKKVTYTKGHSDGTSPMVTAPDVLLDITSPKTKKLFDQAVRRAKR